jgi:hypothetical protein
MLEDFDEQENFDNLGLFPSALLYREYLKEKRIREKLQKEQDDEAKRRKDMKEKAKKMK